MSDLNERIGEVLAEVEQKRRQAQDILDKLDLTRAALTAVRLMLLIQSNEPDAIIKAVQEMMR